MSSEEQIAYIRQKAQNFMRQHDLRFTAIDSSGQKIPYPPPEGK